MTTLAAISGGSAPHLRTFYESEHADRFDRVLHLPEFGSGDLSDVDGLFVPSRLHIEQRNAHGDRLRGFLEDGGTVVTFGQQADPWLPGVDWTHRPTNFWWWLDDGDSGLRFPTTDHPFFEYVLPEDCEWHFHGSFDPPAGATVLVEDDEGEAVLYVDDDSWAGQAIVTTLDPVYHYGSYFMPATDRFLAGVLPWLHDEVL